MSLEKSTATKHAKGAERTLEETRVWVEGAVGRQAGEPVEEGSHPECAPGPLLQPCCLASKNIYSLPKTAPDFFPRILEK